MQNEAKVNCAAFHAPSNLLVVGFSNGLFGLYDLPEFNQIHQLRYKFIENPDIIVLLLTEFLRVVYLKAILMW